MRDFLDYLQESFVTATGGNRYDNSYSNLDLNARSLLSFHTPAGSRVTLTSFVRPKFGTSYSIGIKDGWISYLYSSHPLHPSTVSSSDRIPLPDLLRCYRSLSTSPIRHAVGHSLVYGRLYLPHSQLEALVAARVSPQVNLTLRAVSQETLRHGGTLLGLATWDDPAGRFNLETLASSDGGVLGLRALWNATTPSSEPGPDEPSDRERINGRFSAGGEIYYGTLNKSGGVSLGARFQTLPTHHGTPLTATLTFNLLGHINATYAVVAGDCTLASQFGFNVYSYESDWAVGMELWRKKRPPVSVEAVPGENKEYEAAVQLSDESTVGGVLESGDASILAVTPPPPETPEDEAVKPPNLSSIRKRIKERSFQAKLEWRLDDDDDDDDNGDGEAAGDTFNTTTATTLESQGKQQQQTQDEFSPGAIKARCDQHMRIGLLYEGRYKSLLFSLGTDIDLKKPDAAFQNVGLAVQYSS